MGLIAVRQLVDAQGIGQCPLRLRQPVRRKQVSGLRQCLQGILNGSPGVPGLKGIGGKFCQMQPVFGGLHPFQPGKGSANAQTEADGKGRTGNTAQHPPPAHPRIVGTQGQEIRQHLLRRLIPQVGVQPHGAVDDGRHLRAVGRTGERHHRFGVFGRADATDQVVQGGTHAVNVRTDVRPDQHQFHLMGGAGVGYRAGTPPAAAGKRQPLTQPHGGTERRLRGFGLGIDHAVIFRRRVAGAATHNAGFAQCQRNVEVNQTDTVVRQTHQVGGLDVAVNISPGRIPMGGTVQVGQRIQQLNGPFHHLRLGEPLAPVQCPVQAFPLDIIHDGIDGIVLDKKVIYPGNARMVQILEDVHLTAEHLRLAGQLPFVGLDHHLLVQTQMIGQIHCTAAA